MLIYMATNKINGKMYVGQTVSSLGKRKYKHINAAKHKHGKMYLHKAIRKYGKDNFTWIIIHDDITDIEELNRLEIYYIRFYNTFKNGYNLTEGGKGVVGRKHSKEARQKMSESRCGENNHMYGKHLSEEHKQKISEANSGEKGYMYGKHLSVKTKKRMSIALSGQNHPLYGKHHSEKSKKKMSEAKIGKYEGKNHPKAVTVTINNKHFDTLNEAAKYMNMTPSAIRYRILHKTKWLDYKYV